MVKKKLRKIHHRKPSRWHAAPLKSTFMLSAILGFLISAYYVYTLSYEQSTSYGFAFMAVFAAMFVAALVSMTKAPVVE